MPIREVAKFFGVFDTLELLKKSCSKFFFSIFLVIRVPKEAFLCWWRGSTQQLTFALYYNIGKMLKMPRKLHGTEVTPVNGQQNWAYPCPDLNRSRAQKFGGLQTQNGEKTRKRYFNFMKSYGWHGMLRAILWHTGFCNFLIVLWGNHLS